MPTVVSAFSTEVESFAELHADFFALTEAINWCTASTVDGRGRPRNRILHVDWQLDGDRPVGTVTTHRTPVLLAHLAGNPFISCAYWTAEHNVVYADCVTSWVEDQPAKQLAWDVMAPKAIRLGYDPYAAWPEGPTDPAFAVLRLQPWRIQITLADLPTARTVASSRVWHR
jgi:hypothetical protein